jgi:hypothetical protein
VNILSGVAVLFTTHAFAHLLRHYFLNAGEAAHSPPFLAGVGIGVGYIFLHRRMFADKTWAVIRGFRAESANWEAIGWRVRVNFVSLLNKIRPKDHVYVLRRVLPSRHSPLQDSGNGIQSVYLTEVPTPRRIAHRLNWQRGGGTEGPSLQIRGSSGEGSFQTTGHAG